ncbi:MAG TPA: Sec-independent protein translocase protein TatB [bacterium]|nr:Sec-independent protein translocase protein TatB [bacterium]
MFGIGIGELMVILVIAVVVLGPKKLPQVARTSGKLYAQFKRTANDLRAQMEQEVRNLSEMEEVKEFKHSMESELYGIKQHVEDYVHAEMARADEVQDVKEGMAQLKELKEEVEHTIRATQAEAAEAGSTPAGDASRAGAPLGAQPAAPAPASGNGTDSGSGPGALHASHAGTLDDSAPPPGKLPS